MASGKFVTYYFATITHPINCFTNLKEDDRKLSLSFYAVLITAVLYTFVYVFLIFGGGQPFKPWLDIPLDTYYRYNVFFCAPSMLLGWILAAAVVHTLSRIVTSSGSFEQTLSVFGFGISIASWTTGIHDLLTSFLGAIQVINQSDYEHALNSPTLWRTLLWIQMIAYLIWFVLLFSKGTKAVYRFTTVQSVIFGVIGLLVYQSFFLIFNR
jgi:hypothetical protein